MKILCLLLFLVSCSTGAQQLRPRLDEELRPYKEDFIKLVNNPKLDGHFKVTEMFFEDLKTEKTSIIGRCNNFDITYSIITIDPGYWRRASPTGRQFTAYHELAHCVCYSPHTQPSISQGGILGFLEELAFAIGIFKKKGFLPDGCPVSIMHPSEFSESCMLTHYNYYMQELKKRCQ